MVCEKGIQILLTTVGAFAAFGLMTVAIGTDYWLYSRALICNSTANVTQDDPHNKDKKDPGALTHSGLWRICCLEGKVVGDILGLWVGFEWKGLHAGTSLLWLRLLTSVKRVQGKLIYGATYFLAIKHVMFSSQTKLLFIRTRKDPRKHKAMSVED